MRSLPSIQKMGKLAYTQFYWLSHSSQPNRLEDRLRVRARSATRLVIPTGLVIREGQVERASVFATGLFANLGRLSTSTPGDKGKGKVVESGQSISDTPTDPDLVRLYKDIKASDLAELKDLLTIQLRNEALQDMLKKFMVLDDRRVILNRTQNDALKRLEDEKNQLAEQLKIKKKGLGTANGLVSSLNQQLGNAQKEVTTLRSGNEHLTSEDLVTDVVENVEEVEEQASVSGDAAEGEGEGGGETAELEDTVFMNKKFCKNPKLAKTDDFFFSGLRNAGNTSNLVRSIVTPANVVQIPSLNTLGISLVCIDYAPNGLNPPDTHPRASDAFIVLEVFGSNLPISSDVLTKAFQVDKNVIDHL
ncbi:hypothetical protein LguiB_033831 [Lonicera macranthoides]